MAALPLLPKASLPLFSNPGRRRKHVRRVNPSKGEVDDKVADALRFYEEFHWGDKPKRVSRRPISDAPEVAVKLGKLYAITYETSKAGEKALWEHEFGEEGGVKPDLVMDAKTKRLHIVGGTYDVKADGIID